MFVTREIRGDEAERGVEGGLTDDGGYDGHAIRHRYEAKSHERDYNKTEEIGNKFWHCEVEVWSPFYS